MRIHQLNLYANTLKTAKRSCHYSLIPNMRQHFLKTTFWPHVRSGFSFSYLWFLPFLYHDYGYCVVERDDSPIAIPTRAPIPNNNYSRKLQVQVALNIEYTRGSHKLTFSSSNNAVDISELHRRAKGLEEWTCAHCTEITGGAFTLFLGSVKTVGGSR